MLFVKDGSPDDLVVRSARVIDPVGGVDTLLDVRVDGGVITELGLSVDANVHLRTPGREDEETISSGTAAAAAGGYCAILAMPNTEPVVDSAAVLGALIEDAQAEAKVRVGFLAAITRGQAGQ